MEIKESQYNFSEMHQRMQFYVDAGILPCCATAVFKGTDLVDYQTFGFMDLETREPLRDDAIIESSTGRVSDIARSFSGNTDTSQVDFVVRSEHTARDDLEVKCGRCSDRAFDEVPPGGLFFHKSNY